MIRVRRSAERGYFDYGWLQTYHTFSFDNYYDAHYMSFRNLRVINQDTIAPGKGFGMHSHHNMEILSYIIQGVMAHEDSLGNKGTIRRGEVQRITAGSGIRHSEYNLSKTDLLELLQVWVLPSAPGLNPSYQQMAFKQATPQFRLLASQDGKQNSLHLNQDTNMFVGTFPAGHSFEYTLEKNRYAWFQIVTGELAVNDELLVNGDGAAISHQERIHMKANQETEFIFFDLN